MDKITDKKLQEMVEKEIDAALTKMCIDHNIHMRLRGGISIHSPEHCVPTKEGKCRYSAKDEQ